MASPVEDVVTHTITWTYLLKQQYLNFIDLDIYNIHEKRHLLDVKRVLETLYHLWLLLLITTTIGMIIFRNDYKKITKQVANLGLFLILFLVFMSIDFINNFDFLHSLLFNAKTWVFSNDSILIELFPLIYFQQFFFFLLTGSLILFTLLFFFSNFRATDIRC
jgi:hypothetical protein